MRVQISSGLPNGQVAKWLKASVCKTDISRGFKSHSDLGVTLQRSSMVEPQVHTLVGAGSSPAAATISGDSVTGNTPVSKTGILSSNLSPRAISPHRLAV